MGKNKNKKKNKQQENVDNEELSPRLEEETTEDVDTQEDIEQEDTAQDLDTAQGTSNGKHTNGHHEDSGNISDPELINHSETNETEPSAKEAENEESHEQAAAEVEQNINENDHQGNLNVHPHRLSVPIQQDPSSSVDYSSAHEYINETENNESQQFSDKRSSHIKSQASSNRNSVAKDRGNSENPRVVSLQDIAYEPNVPPTDSTPLLSNYNNNEDVNENRHSNTQYRSILQSREGNNPNTVNNSPGLLSFARFKRIFSENSSSYLISTLIVIFFILASLTVIVVLLVQRIFHPSHPIGAPRPLPKYPNPYKFVEKIGSAKAIRDTLDFLGEKSYFSGDKDDQELISNLESRFKGFNLKTEVIPYYPYISKPDDVKIEVTDPPKFQYVCSTYEPRIDEDKGTHEKPSVLAYHPYASFDTTKARMVYVNYGTVEDFKTLLDQDTRVVGRIIIVRQGKIPLGEIIDNAYEFGAVGVITFFDPADDGYYKGPLYPVGPYRNQNTISRDTSLNWITYPGDPLTPGVAAGYSANRTTPGKAKNIPRILVLPVNVNDATQLFKTLVKEGTKVDKFDKSWKGGLPLSYYTGPSSAHIEMTLKGEGRQKPIWNLLSTIKGIQYPNQIVVIGGKRDNLGKGGTHGSVSTSALMEVTRILDEYQKTGWRPARTIIVGSWDGTELGLLGSTEWVEDQLKRLNGSAIAYIDIGDVVGPNFKASSTYSLSRLLKSITKSVASPNRPDSTIYDDFKKSKSEVGDLNEMKDYIPFFYHAGIPSIHVSYDGPDTVHNSHYDTLHNLFKLKDPSLNKTLAIAQVASVLTIELATNAIVPLNITEYGFKIKRDFDVFIKKYRKVTLRNAIDLDSISQSIQLISDSAEALDYEIQFFYNYYGYRTCNDKKCFKVQKLINDRIIGFESMLMQDKLDNLIVDPDYGIIKSSADDEDWYKHGLYRPNGHKGSSPTLLKRFEKSIIDEDWEAAKDWQVKLEKFFENAADSLAFDTGLADHVKTL